MKITKEQKGITLVALIITIIVLLIISGVTINTIVNNNWLNNAQTAVQKSNEKIEEEETLIGQLNELLNRWSDGEGGGEEIEEPEEPQQPEDDTDEYIYDVATLSAFRDKVNAGQDYTGKVVKVTADIDFGENNTTNWDPIASGTSFNGTFDGMGHTIKNLYINYTSTYGKGLFYTIGKTGIVKNLIVDGKNLSSAGNIARNSMYQLRNSRKVWKSWNCIHNRCFCSRHS